MIFKKFQRSYDWIYKREGIWTSFLVVSGRKDRRLPRNQKWERITLVKCKEVLQKIQKGNKAGGITDPKSGIGFGYLCWAGKILAITYLNYWAFLRLEKFKMRSRWGFSGFFLFLVFSKEIVYIIWSFALNNSYGWDRTRRNPFIKLTRWAGYVTLCKTFSHMNPFCLQEQITTLKRVDFISRTDFNSKIVETYFLWEFGFNPKIRFPTSIFNRKPISQHQF